MTVNKTKKKLCKIRTLVATCCSWDILPPLYVPSALLPSGAPEALFTAAVLRLLTQLSAFHWLHMLAHMVGAHHQGLYSCMYSSACPGWSI